MRLVVARYVRQNEVTPGAVRSEEDAIKESGVSADAKNETGVDTSEIAETKEALRQEKERLRRSKDEANLLQRKLDLDTHTIYTNPEYTAQKSGRVKLTAEKNQIGEKENEIRQTEQKIAELEEHLQDLRLRSANKTGVTETPVTKIEEKDEAYWRKKFAEIHYKIRRPNLTFCSVSCERSTPNLRSKPAKGVARERDAQEYKRPSQGH